MNVSDHIHGWKEIGSYIGRTERTARRWEIERRLPVRRTPGQGRSSVYAIKSELDGWLLSTPAIAEDREVVLAVEATHAASPIIGTEAPATTRRGWLAPALVTAALLAIAATTAASVRRTGRDNRLAVRAAGSTRTSPVPGVNELYLRGLGLYEKRTVPDVNNAFKLFLEATDRDPKFAPAWASLGNAYTVLGEYESINNLDAYAKARDAAEKALALDPSLAEPHANLGFLDFFRVGDQSQAEREFRMALALDPRCAMAHSWFGTMLTYQGRLPEALREFDVASQIEPHSSAIMAGRALALGLAGHRNEGLAILEKLNREAPNPMIAHHLSTLAVMQPRNVELFLRSRAEIALMEHLAPSVVTLYTDAEKKYVPGRSGEQAVWEALAQSKDSYPLLQAEANAALGKADDAFAILDSVVNSPGPAANISSDPMLISLHSDRRWPALVSLDNRLGLRTRSVSTE